MVVLGIPCMYSVLKPCLQFNLPSDGMNSAPTKPARQQKPAEGRIFGKPYIPAEKNA